LLGKFGAELCAKFEDLILKILICYKTKNGVTKKYMDWLAEAFDADVKIFDEVLKRYDFVDYDAVVVSSGTYAGFMPLNRFLKKHWKELDDKKVFVVAVGGLAADDSWSKWSYKRIPEKIRQKISYYKVMGDLPEPSRPVDYKSPVKKENLDKIIEDINSVDS
jgi:flavodoxin